MANYRYKIIDGVPLFTFGPHIPLLLYLFRDTLQPGVHCTLKTIAQRVQKRSTQNILKERMHCENIVLALLRLDK